MTDAAYIGLTGTILGGAIGFFSALGMAWRSDRNARRNNSRLGVAIIDELLEEMSHGVRIMTDLARRNLKNERLPTQSWSGMGTIPSEVLLRIHAIVDSDSERDDYARGVRSHLKNYFEHICPALNSMICALATAEITPAQRVILDEKLVAQATQSRNDTKHLVCELEALKASLRQNARKYNPR